MIETDDCTMSRNYKFGIQENLLFVIFTIIYWFEAFIVGERLFPRKRNDAYWVNQAESLNYYTYLKLRMAKLAVSVSSQICQSKVK
jgi:hypothetical protein